MLRDDHPGYYWILAFPSKEAQYAAPAIIDCCAAFGVPKGFIFDSQHNFKMGS